MGYKIQRISWFIAFVGFGLNASHNSVYIVINHSFDYNSGELACVPSEAEGDGA